MASMSGQPITQAFLDENNYNSLHSICIAFIVLDVFFVAIRFIARYLQRAPLGWDDYLIVIALINLLGLEIDGLLSYRWGVGYHIQRVASETPNQISDWGKNSLIAVPILYVTATLWPKLSVLMLYLRIFTDKFSRVSCWVLGAILVVGLISNILGEALQCFPIEKAWNPVLPGWCSNIEAHLIYGNLPNNITDIAMLLLPIPVVLRLQAAKHVKIGLLATFLVGAIGMVTSFIRLVEFFRNKYADDGTWFAAPLFIWAIVEPSIYLMCACLLTFRPVVVKIIHSPRVLSFYSWWTRQTSYSQFNETNGDAKAGSEGHVKVTDSTLCLGKHIGSAEAIAERGEWYGLEPTKPQEIHIHRGFNVESSNGRA